MPAYGIRPGDGEEPLPWSWAEERLRTAHNYWISSVTPAGRPHAMAVWGTWFEGEFWFSTAAGSRKARNLEATPWCVVTTDLAAEAVVVEGEAREERGLGELRRWKQAYDEKYAWDIDIGQGGIFRVKPTVAFGFTESSETFHNTATRWKW